MAITLPGCATSDHAPATSRDGFMAIYSPPVRLGGQGSMIFLPAPQRAGPADARIGVAPDEPRRPVPTTQAIPAVSPPLEYDCFAPGPWIVFFRRNGTKLRDEAKQALASLVRYERGVCGNLNLDIEGHRVTGERLTLSRQRADAVRRHLQRQRIEVDMDVKDLGNRRPRVPDTSEEADIHNPRVEIHVRY